MIKKCLLSICSLFVIFSIFSSAFSQETPTPEIERLNGQIAELQKQNKFDEAVKLAEKVVSLEKSGKNPQKYAQAMFTLATLKKQKLESSGFLTKPSANPNVVISFDEFDKTENLFRDVITVFDKQTGDKLQSANAKLELTWFLTMKIRLFAPGSKKKTLESETEKLYTDALYVYEQTFGENSDAVIALLDKIETFYFRTGNFEKFLPVNQKQISLIEKNFSADNKRLISPLRFLADFMALTGNAAGKNEVTARLAKIEGEKTSEREYFYDILNRADSDIDIIIGTPKVSRTEKSRTDLNLDEIFSNAPSPATMQRINPDARTAALTGITYPTYVNRGNTKISDQFDPAPEVGVVTMFGAAAVAVNVTVDEAGAVEKIETVYPQDAKIQEKVQKTVEKRAKKWRFQPLVLDGKNYKYSGQIFIQYFD